MTQDDKTKNTRPKSNNDKMENKEGVKAQGIKLKYSYEKKNDYGTNHFFQVLDESPLKEIIELGKDIKMPVWEYNGISYLKFNEKKVYDYSIGLMIESDGSEVTQITVKKDVPYIVGFTFTKYDYERNQEQITGYFYKKYTIYQILIYRDGIARIIFKYYY